MNQRRDQRQTRDGGLWLPWRWPVEMAATIQEQGSCALAIKVIDLSMTGCRLWAGFRLIAGRPALLAIEGLAPLRGHLVWAENWYAAIRFDRPLHSAVLTHLIARYPPRPAANDIAH